MLRLVPLLALLAVLPASSADKPAAITWKKTVLDRNFRSEGVAVADVNKDGKLDVLNGEYWYEAPEWTPHEMQPFHDWAKETKDGLAGYSRSFACWADDFNADGFPDLIVIDHPGKPCYWAENPKGQKGHWKKHAIWHSACNETPLYTDLLATGKRVLVMGFQPPGKGNEGQMAYFTPDPENPTELWVMHPVSVPSAAGKEIPGTQRYSHGLGAGDVNSDGRTDVICTAGWWEQPEKADGKTPWKFHPAAFGEACADMFAYDVNGDGLNDIISTSAHRFGIWVHKQGRNKEKNTTWSTTTLFGELVSETHAAHFIDLDGDGQKDIVTGKRWWSHGRSEPGSSWSAAVYYLKGTKNGDKVTSFFPVLIDDDCGIGTQFAVEDINGDKVPDIIVSNKKGVRILVQERK